MQIHRPRAGLLSRRVSPFPCWNQATGSTLDNLSFRAYGSSAWRARPVRRRPGSPPPSIVWLDYASLETVRFS